MSRRDAIISLALVALVILLYSPVVQYDFLDFDDATYITKNRRVLEGLNAPNVGWAFTTFTFSNWHPLTWLSHMADVSMFGTKAGGHHFVNVLLHAANAALVYLVLSSLTAAPWRSAIVAALFAVHPLRLESVAWIAERKDLLSGLFFLLAIHSYACCVRTKREVTPLCPGTKRGHFPFCPWLTAGCMVLSLMAKPMAVTLPCVLLLLDIWPLKRLTQETVGRRIVEKLPLFAIAAVFSIVAIIAQHSGGAMEVRDNFPLTLRIGNAIYSYGRYLLKTVWPAKLAVFYPYEGADYGTTIPWPRVALSAIALAIITAIVITIWRRKRDDAVLIGWLWFLGMLIPTIGLVQVGAQSMADRYTYLPHIGLFIAIVWAAPRRLAPLGVAAVAALAISTAWQLPRWRNTETLFRHAIAVTDRNSRAHTVLATHLVGLGRKDEAAAHFVEALRVAPANVEALHNLGQLHFERGQIDRAREYFLQTLQVDPEFAEAHSSLANLLADEGKIEQAFEHYERAIQLKPGFAPFYFNYGILLARLNRIPDAQAKFAQVLEQDPGYLPARSSYALTLMMQGKHAQALEQFQRAIALNPNSAEALANAAWVMSTSPDAAVRDGRRAVELARRACELTEFRDPELMQKLSAAFAEAGDFERAIAAAEDAQRIADASGNADLANRVGQKIELYRQRQPYRQPAVQP